MRFGSEEGASSRSRYDDDETPKVKTTRKKKDASGDYFSDSDIDHPPIGEAKETRKQKEIFEPTIEEKLNAENAAADRMFTVELSLSLKPKGGKAVKIPIFADDLRGSIVEEALKLSFDSRRFRNVMKSVLDLPEVK